MKSGFTMNSRIKHTLWKYLAAPLALAGIALSLSSCGNSNAESAADETKRPDDVVNVSVETVQKTDFYERLKLSGAIKSFEDVKLSSEEGGKLVKWVAGKGSRVSAGTIIARLDSSLLKPQYEAALAQYKLAQVTYEKQKKVYEENAISELQLKTFEYQRDAAKAQSDLMKSRFEKTIIRSPIAGFLNDRFYEEGELVPPGMPLAHIVSDSRLKIAAGVPERYAGRLNVGDAVQFTTDAFPGEVFNGKLTFIASAVNSDNRTIPVEVTISGSGKLKPDMIATINLTLKAVKNAVVIPSDYIQQVDMNRFVVYVDNNGTAEERTVTIESTSQGKAHISKGIGAGERLITLGFQNVSQGQKINVK